MNLTLFILLLSFLRSTGWCHALGSSGDGACPQVTCSLTNRESCSLGSNECGSCLKGFFEVAGECIPIESSPNEDSWESELEGTDGSDLSELFDTTHAPTEKHTEKHNSPISTPDSIDFTTPSAPATGVEENPNDLNKNYDLGRKAADKNSESSVHQTEDESKQNGAKQTHSSNDFKTKSKDLKYREQNRSLKRKILLKKQDKNFHQKQKKLDEEKLNKFLSNKDESEEIISSNEDGVNLEGNSSTNPPPFIRKHKIGKSEEAKASEMDDIYFLFIVIGCSVAGIAGLGLAGYCWYKLHTTAKAVSESEYTGYGMKGSTKRPPSLHGDDKLDYNAEMYHYHQTKSQLAAMEKAGAKSSKQGSMEDDENSDEGDEGDYTVYECPGLAPTGDMTVVNPLFSDQEAVGSDQDANGNRSGHSSPTSSRHSTTTKSAE